MKNQISEFLRSKINEGDFPSAVYLVAEKGEIILHDALGFAVVEPEKIEAKIDTIYDLASLTKPLVTGLLCARLIEDGVFSLNYKIYSFIRDLFDYEITFQHLLTHTSGCPSWIPFYLLNGEIGKVHQKLSAEIGKPIFKKKDVIEFLITNLKDKIETNSKVIYSDLNFIGLGLFLEGYYSRIWKMNLALDEIAKREIFEPLILKDTFFNPPKNLQKRIAASEKGNEFEKQMCLEKGYEIRNPKSQFRNRIVWGEVHDGNCYFMNGVSGHAGLFSTAEETFKIAQQFLANQTTLLKPETCELFRTNYTKGMNEARSIAFQLAETPESTASDALSKDSFGHLGFTGTSVWIEPETERIFILLTNRTHDRELPFVNINSTRRRFHELATEILNARKS